MSDEEHEEHDVEDSSTSVSQGQEQDFSLDLSTSSSIQEISKKFKDVKSQAEKMKGKKKNAEDGCLSVIGKQLTAATSAEMTKSSTSEESASTTVDEDELFCKMPAQ